MEYIVWEFIRAPTLTCIKVVHQSIRSCTNSSNRWPPHHQCHIIRVSDHAIEYEDIVEQKGGQEIRASTKEDLLPKKDYFSTDVWLASLEHKKFVPEEENYDDDIEEALLPVTKSIDDVVMIPTYSNNVQRQATKDDERYGAGAPLAIVRVLVPADQTGHIIGNLSVGSKRRMEGYNTALKRMMRNPYEYHHDLGMSYTSINVNLIVDSQPQKHEDINHLKHEEKVAYILCLQQEKDLEVTLSYESILSLEAVLLHSSFGTLERALELWNCSSLLYTTMHCLLLHARCIYRAHVSTGGVIKYLTVGSSFVEEDKPTLATALFEKGKI